jgi:GNAT superfamily N-acetyltransferase
MAADRSPLFCNHGLAARIERAEAGLMAATTEAARRRGAEPAGFAIPIASGMATFAEAGSPVNKVAGLGFGGLPEDGELGRVETAFAERRAPVRVEISTLADPALGELLAAHGYRLTGFENVLGRGLAEAFDYVSPPGVEIRTSGDAELEAWLDVVVDAVAHPDVDGAAAHEEFPRDAIERAERDLLATGVERWTATRGSAIAGGGGLRVEDGIAQLAGAATAPAHRRRGIQGALLATRLAAAAAAGCDIAVVTTQPGSTSQRNVQRHGFDLLYARAVLVRVPAP